MHVLVRYGMILGLWTRILWLGVTNLRAGGGGFGPPTGSAGIGIPYCNTKTDTTTQITTQQPATTTTDHTTTTNNDPAPILYALTSWSIPLIYKISV